MKVNHVRKCVSVCSFLNKHSFLKKQNLKFIWKTTTKTALQTIAKLIMKVNHVRKCVSVCSFQNKHSFLEKQSLKFIWKTTYKDMKT